MVAKAMFLKFWLSIYFVSRKCYSQEANYIDFFY